MLKVSDGKKKKYFKIAVRKKDTLKNLSTRVRCYEEESKRVKGIRILEGFDTSSQNYEIFTFMFRLSNFKSLKECRDWVESKGYKEIREFEDIQ